MRHIGTRLWIGLKSLLLHFCVSLSIIVDVEFPKSSTFPSCVYL